jgi:hypothetical protein
MLIWQPFLFLFVLSLLVGINALMVARGRGVLPVHLAHSKEQPRSHPQRATMKDSVSECDIYAIVATFWSHPGEDKPSPLLWTGLASRFVGIVRAHPCGRPAAVALPSRLLHSLCHSPIESEDPPHIHPATLIPRLINNDVEDAVEGLCDRPRYEAGWWWSHNCVLRESGTKL